MKNELKNITADLAAYVKQLDGDTYQGASRKSQITSHKPQATSHKSGTGHKPETVRETRVTEKEAVPAPRDGATGMGALAEEIRVCRKCCLGHSRLNAVVGVGNAASRVVFVGEGPGFQEDHKGEPFVGRSGQLLDKILDTVLGLKREDVYIANIVKCHPMKDPESPESHGNDRPPSPEEISACRPYLDRQLLLIKPRCIVTLGSVATKVLLGVTQGISLVRGKWYDYPVDLFGPDHPIRVLPTYHPAALLRNPNLKRETWEDMKMLKTFLEESPESGV